MRKFPSLGNTEKFTVAVIAGGTVSKLGGGKFANGAVTAAFGFMFNELRLKNAELESKKSCLMSVSSCTQVVDRSGGKIWVATAVADKFATAKALNVNVSDVREMTPEEFYNFTGTVADTVTLIHPLGWPAKIATGVEWFANAGGAIETGDPTKFAGSIVGGGVAKFGKMAPEVGEAASKRAGAATSLSINNSNINEFNK